MWIVKLNEPAKPAAEYSQGWSEAEPLDPIHSSFSSPLQRATEVWYSPLKRSLIAIATVLLALALSTLASAQTNKTDDARLAKARKAIDAGNVEWIAGQKAGDADRMAALFDSDGSQFGAKGRVIRGRKAIHDRFANGFKTNGPALDFTITTLEVWLVDDLAYESGNYTLKLQPKGKEVSSFSGKYVTIWKRQRDGSWKIWVDFGVPE
ncbi:MAG TPA: nuclear transport factor 2 family protein [Pyrinomonadaceae bacterium]|nr:nuclear transport factor 2 family protein [Pyrinomonadaceae bacterium]